MILDLLRRLEQNPSALFAENELRATDPVAFDDLVGAGTLFELFPVATTVVKDGRLLEVESLGDGSLVGWDENDPEYGPVRVDAAEVRVWQVDVAQVAERLAATLRLGGKQSELSERAVFLGDAPGGVAVLLTWLPEHDTGEQVLRGVRSLLPTGYSGFVSISPSYSPRKAFERELQALRIATARITSNELQIEPQLATLLDRLAGRTSYPTGSFESADGRLQYHADFTWLRFDGKARHPGEYQALVLARLHAAGGPTHEGEVLEHLESTILSKRIYDLFRRSPLLGTLLIADGDGIYSLASY
jgi:hypothetical protein